MQEELDSLIANLTWKLVTLPEGKHALYSKWIFKAKPQLDSMSVCLKAHLVARGLKQKFGIYYNITFAPVVCWSTLRALISLSVALGWKLHHIDVIPLFVNGKLRELIYMK